MRQKNSTLGGRLWMAVSAVLLAAAIYFLWAWQIDAAFVTATLGAVAWFLNLRGRLRGALVETGETAGREEVSDES